MEEKDAHGHKGKRFVVRKLEELSDPLSHPYAGREGVSRYDSIEESRRRSGFDFVLEFDEIGYMSTDGFQREEVLRTE